MDIPQNCPALNTSLGTNAHPVHTNAIHTNKNGVMIANKNNAAFFILINM